MKVYSGNSKTYFCRQKLFCQSGFSTEKNGFSTVWQKPAKLCALGVTALMKTLTVITTHGMQ